MILQKIAKLSENLTLEKLFQRDDNEVLNRLLFQQICDELIDAEIPNRKAISELIGSFEKLNEKAFSFLMDFFFDKFERIKKKKKISLDRAILKSEFSDESELMMKRIMKNSMEKNNKLQISNYPIDFLDSSQEQQKEILAMLIHIVQDRLSVLTYVSDEDVSDLNMFYTFARQYAVNLKLERLFYFSFGAYIERLNLSEKNQFCRDIAEETLLASYHDNCKDAGFYLIFKAYANQASTIAAAVYLNLFTRVLERQNELDEFVFQGLIMETIKYLRNIKLISLAIIFHDSIPKNTFPDTYQKLSLANTYFTLLLHEMPDSLPNQIFDYLNTHREDILRFDENDMLPWVVTLYNIKKNYSKKNIDFLNIYIDLFESIVPKESYIPIKNVLFGDLKSITKDVKNSLVNISRTRYKMDFVNDIKKINVKARVLLNKSFEENNTYGFLLAMMVNSDYSFVIQDAEQTEDAIEVSISDKEFFHEIYDHPIELLLGLKLNKDVKILWLAADHNLTYSLIFGNKTFSKIQLLENFNFKNIKNWKRTDGDNLALKEYKKSDNGNIIKLFKADFENQDLEIEANLKFASIDINPKPKYLLIIKDMELSAFPHNLFLDKNAKFLYPQVPIASILSLDWFYQIKQKDKKLINDFTKEIWIPIESGDFALNNLFSRIEAKLNEKKFNIHTSPFPKKPINSNINVIAAHGGDDIAFFSALFNNDKLSIPNLNYVVGDGDVLIMLVCHSGSMDRDFYRGRVSTLIRKFLEGKYQAVVAPFWALHINIPEIWLPEFLIQINNGEYIIDAVYKANLKVYEVYPVAGAWSCMHLYGNPFFQKKS